MKNTAFFSTLFYVVLHQAAHADTAISCHWKNHDYVIVDHADHDLNANWDYDPLSEGFQVRLRQDFEDSSHLAFAAQKRKVLKVVYFGDLGTFVFHFHAATGSAEIAVINLIDGSAATGPADCKVTKK